jgi:3-phosphoshikimate 1-carboxyvinyltransferase
MKKYIKIYKKINSFNKKIEVSGDKSISIRCVLLASQAIGVSKITNLLESEDVLNALKAIKHLGINYKKKGNAYFINSYGLNSFKIKNKLKINAGNSGTLARLLLGLLVDTKKEITIVGDNSLSNRDFSRVTEPLKLFGANINSNNKKLPVKILGTEFLRPINYFETKGSAQCKSCVMLAALKTPGLTRIKARKSRNHTELLFKYLNIPGDISSSSFFIVLAILSKDSKLIIKNVNINKSRTGIIKILRDMNAKVYLKNIHDYNGEKIADIYAESTLNLKSINCPAKINSSAIDEFLIIFLVAARAKGVSSFKNLGELNKKESPRLDIAVNFLNLIGVKTKRIKNNLKIYGNPKIKLEGNFVMKNFMKDHRVFMMSAITALTFGGNWKIFDKDSVNTSFPNFFKILKFIGAQLN